MSSEIEQLYYRYGAMVLRRCRQLLVDPHLAEEAMQDTFVNVLKQKERLQLTTPSSLLYRIATNVCLNLIRDGKNGQSSQNPDEQEMLYQISNDTNLEQQTISQRLLEKIFGKQQESTRVIATLHYYDGMTLQEVAAETGMSVSGVRKRLQVFKEKVEKFRHEMDN